MSKLTGILLAIASSATFGLIPLFSIPVLESGVNLESLCFYRFLVATLLMALFMLVKGVSFKIKREEFIPLFILSIFYASTSLFLTGSYAYMPSSIATTIHFLYPVLVTTIMILFFKERFSLFKGIAVVAALIGVYFLSGSADSSSTESISLMGLLFVFITIITYGTYIVGVNQIPILKRVNGTTLTFYILANSAFFFLCNLVFRGVEFSVVDSASQWYNIIALGLFATLISDLTLVYAIQIIGSTVTAILGCMEPLTAVIVGITLFKERITNTQYIGILFVFVAVYLVIMAQNREKSLSK